MVWRLIVEDGAGAADGLATDEVLARRVGSGVSEPTLRLYTYRPHVVLVGRFQDLEHEVCLESCRARGIGFNRRPTGGGAILMGPDQLGVALTLPGRELPVRARQLMERFSAGLIEGLERLGIRCGFRGKNDLEVGGRKIAGLGIYRDATGGLLFHASVLVDLDVSLMESVLRAARVPAVGGSARDRELEAIVGRTATLGRLLGATVGMSSVRARVAEGFGAVFRTAFRPGTLDPAERGAVDRLVRDKYATRAWVFQRARVPHASGAAARRTRGGTVRARVELEGAIIKAIHLRGDFFEEEGAIAELEGRLRWHSARPDAVAATVEAWGAARCRGSMQPIDLQRCILAAVAGARTDAPHGCFVRPSVPVDSNRAGGVRESVHG